ncbi:MAG: DNA-binding transcriptional regulator [Ignavibacteriaceae bacterium]|nr:DNA-binding transcriptional regulator [Ignavibacteriaceae bacterium]
MNNINLRRVILLLETSRAFGRGILTGVAKYSKLHGPWTFYREPRSLKSSIPHLVNWKANGIIMRNTVINRQFIDLKIPVIFVLHEKRIFPNIPIIITNGKGIAKLAAEHLISKGLKNFAYCGLDLHPWSDERKKYFQQFINEAGFEVSIYQQSHSNKYKSWENEQLRMAEWLKSLTKPVGIMACNDDRGQHVLEACKNAGLYVPEDVSVIGVDNDSLVCDLCDPPLSSVALNTEYAGYYAAELLDQLMKGAPSKGQEILVEATHIVKRQSTDILAVEDKNVAEAIRYIRNNAKNKFFVNDVVNQTSLCRRSLESRFKKIIHRSIQEEIRRVRTELIADLLVDTDLPISEITNMFNFIDIEHISRYFKKVKGVGLREFRNSYRKF